MARGALIVAAAQPCRPTAGGCSSETGHVLFDTTCAPPQPTTQRSAIRNGRAAVFSLADAPARVAVPLASIGARPDDAVRELWTHAEMPHEGGTLHADLAPHGGALCRLPRRGRGRPHGLTATRGRSTVTEARVVRTARRRARLKPRAATTGCLT
ncbi:hypothetical protein [Streptomyces sp. PT12]|uniref:hypothetical protein n=1 Tax=Streptomyces sp. PT12 TaxID=1510197 RepID=UPI000DE43E04|nr:hypothetical protein DEH69_20310 [Streptomyces sp. PT12]